MAACLRACLQSTLKILNSVIGLFGVAMILYSLWMIRACYRKIGEFSQGFSDSGSSPSWFIYIFLGLGIFLCVLTCFGHIAAETVSSRSLSCYAAVVFILLIVEAAIIADILLNRNWEEDFPHDPTGRFKQFTDFIQMNSGLCKVIVLMVLAVQALSIFLAMNLRSLGPDHSLYDESDDDSVPATLPLLRNHLPNPRTTDQTLSRKNYFWVVWIHDKVFR